MPGGRLGNLYSPSALVWKSWRAPEFSFMSVSFAPGITAPLESVTDPESEALTSCPKLCRFKANRNIPRRTAQRYVLALQTLPRIGSPFDLHTGSRHSDLLPARQMGANAHPPAKSICTEVLENGPCNRFHSGA